MNNDLISREALKKDIDFQYICKCCHNVNGNVCDICPITEIEKKIDNAPTVEPCKDCEDRRQAEYIRHGSSWHELQSLRKFKEEHERPQGEWRVKTLSTFPQYQPDEYECPFCKTIVNYKTNFCHKCGADMRKGGAE